MPQQVLMRASPDQAASPSFAPRLSLRRACACGGTPREGGECASCRAKRLAEASQPAPSAQIAHDFGQIGVYAGPAQSLPVGPAGDAYEREADSIAATVTRPASGETTPSAAHGVSVHRSAAYSASGSPLSREARSYFEPRLGHDLAEVRLHTDARAARMSRAISADAFTYGADIFFGERRFAPGTEASNRLLAHELVHTVQQRSLAAPSLRRQQTDDPGKAGSPVAAALPVGGAAMLLPPGDCTTIEHRVLQDEVDRACDRDTRCTQKDDCATLWAKIGFNAECIKARTVINVKCFRGGNIGHVIALANAVAGLARCWAVYGRECQQHGPPVPVPVPEKAPETEKKPVVDKSFMDRMAAVTGLTGTALIVYLIISEGSRLFPPRNLVPVP